jgi:membrane peptidoglycan carboxypeptidase
MQVTSRSGSFSTPSYQPPIQRFGDKNLKSRLVDGFRHGVSTLKNVARNPKMIFRGADGKIRKKLFIALGIFVALCVAFLAFIMKDVPSPTTLKDNLSFAVSTQIMDRNGTLLYEIYADKKRTPISLKDLPPYVYQASIAIEDQKFYKHHGFDAQGMLRAIRNTLFKQQLQGGSTITQQLIKTSLLTRERTVTRKIKEAVLTVATEVIYKKDEILEMYLNNIPYGGTAWGIEAAAQTYFDKVQKTLRWPRLPCSRVFLNPQLPFGVNPQLAKDRQGQVLRRMVEINTSHNSRPTGIGTTAVYNTPKINIQAIL